MASSAEHRAKYQDNRAFLDADGGLAAKQPRWAAVVAFYAALHLVERLAALQNIHHYGGGAHTRRHQFLASHPRHHVIHDPYLQLQRVSEVSRYGTLNQFQRMLSAADVQSVVIDGCLATIEAYVELVFHPPAAGS